MSVCAKLPSLTNEQKSVISFSAMLAVTGISLFIWMAGTGWVDKTGVVVSCIFVALTALQVCLSVVWWRVTKWSRFAEHLPKSQSASKNVEEQGEESVEMLKHKESLLDKSPSNANGSNNGAVQLPQDIEPLRHRGDGDHSENSTCVA